MSEDPDSSDPDETSVLVAVTLHAPVWRAALPDAVPRARQAARAALAEAAGAARRAPLELSVVLADDTLLQRLNHDYRGIDRPTNVLAFPAEDEARDGAERRLLGDVVVSYGAVQREAAEQGKSLADHLSHLIVHGVLHLVGYDHQAEAQAREMERLEVAVLARLGVADPYRSGAAAAARGARR